MSHRYQQRQQTQIFRNSKRNFALLVFFVLVSHVYWVLPWTQTKKNQSIFQSRGSSASVSNIAILSCFIGQKEITFVYTARH